MKALALAAALAVTGASAEALTYEYTYSGPTLTNADGDTLPGLELGFRLNDGILPTVPPSIFYGGGTGNPAGLSIGGSIMDGTIGLVGLPSALAAAVTPLGALTTARVFAIEAEFVRATREINIAVIYGELADGSSFSVGEGNFNPPFGDSRAFRGPTGNIIDLFTGPSATFTSALVVAVPEIPLPASAPLMGLALVGLLGWRRATA